VCDCPPKTGQVKLPSFDLASQFRHGRQGTLSDGPIVHIQTPRDKHRVDRAFPSQEISRIQCRISVRPRDRDATHHIPDEVLWVVGKILSCAWPDQDVQAGHVWDKGLEREWSIPVWNRAIRLGVLAYLPLRAVSIV
jgi:hypothetical protein